MKQENNTDTNCNKTNSIPNSNSDSIHSMDRRTFSQLVIATPLTTGNVSGSNATNEDTHRNISVKGFFTSLRQYNSEAKKEIIINCASEMCLEGMVSTEETDEIVNTRDKLTSVLTRIRNLIKLLRGTGVTEYIDPEDIQDVSSVIRRSTDFAPVIGSANNLVHNACQLDSEQNPENIRDFLYACIAFGIEVTLWRSRVSFKLAWSGTRFIANKTFIRYVNVCDKCVSVAMSELHWVLRRLPNTVTQSIEENERDFIKNERERVSEYVRENDFSFENKTISTGNISNKLESTPKEISEHINQAPFPIAGGGGSSQSSISINDAVLAGLGGIGAIVLLNQILR